MEKIDWPNWWKGSGKHFLEGFPFIGTQVNIFKNACSVLERREEKDVRKAWIEIGENYSCVREKLNKLLDLITPFYFYRWPNALFIPSDNLSIVLLLIPGLIDDSEDIINEIQRGFELDRNSLMKMYDILDEDGDVLRFIQLLNINNGNPEGI